MTCCRLPELPDVGRYSALKFKKKIMLEFCTRYHFLIRLSIILQKLILKGGFSRDLVLRHGFKIFLAKTI